MDFHVLELIFAVVTTILASSGFWAYIQYRTAKNDDSQQLLLGLAHDRIMSLGKSYIEKGEITADEYANLVKYLYIPYKKCGGNGSAEHVVDAVKRLPMVS